MSLAPTQQPVVDEDEEGWGVPMNTLKAEMRERPSGAPKVLMRRQGASAAPGDGGAHGSSTKNVAKSEVERERDYAAARERIFGKESAAGGGTVRD